MPAAALRVLWLVPISALLLLNLFVAGSFRLPFPEANAMRVPSDDAVESGAFLTLGMRRLAADLSLIRLIMYYGTPELEHAEEGHDHASHTGRAHGVDYGGGSYHEILDRTLQVLDLDPYFTYAALFSAGALAFNLQRPDEALAVLQKAMERNPKEWTYHAYVVAIGFHKKGDAKQVLEQLTPVLSEPDCPTLLKNMVAFLNRRLGHKEEAIRLYREILLAKDKSYEGFARRALVNSRGKCNGD